MLVNKAISLYTQYLRDNARPHTIRVFLFALTRFDDVFGGREINTIKDNEIVEFIVTIADGRSPSTKNHRVNTIRAFFNFTIEIVDDGMINPCMRPIIKKMFKGSRGSSPKLLDKDLIDEIIFRTTDERNRLILELMGRAGMRVGEVLGIRKKDINFESSTILIVEPKSGRSGEKVYVAKKLCSKLHAFLSSQNIGDEDKVFNISYSTAHRMVKKSGLLVNAKLRPHDLRRHAATQASRNNVPLEIVSKVILRHADISTTQRYLGTVDPSEASRWIEQLNG